MAEVSQTIHDLEVLLTCLGSEVEEALLRNLILEDIIRLRATSRALQDSHILTSIVNRARERILAWTGYMRNMILLLKAPSWEADFIPTSHGLENKQREWMELAGLVDPTLAQTNVGAPIITRRQWYRHVLEQGAEEYYQQWKSIPLPPYIREVYRDPNGMWIHPRYYSTGVIRRERCDVPRCAEPRRIGTEIPYDLPESEDTDNRVLNWCVRHAIMLGYCV